MEETKIAAAVEKCVAYANDGEEPIGRTADFLLVLQSSEWSPGDLIEVRTLALAELGKRFAAALPKQLL